MSVTVTTAQTLQCDPVPGADSYEFELMDNVGASLQVFPKSGPSIPVAELVTGRTLSTPYQVRARGLDEWGVGPWSLVKAFTVISALVAPTNLVFV